MMASTVKSRTKERKSFTLFFKQRSCLFDDFNSTVFSIILGDFLTLMQIIREKGKTELK